MLLTYQKVEDGVTMLEAYHPTVGKKCRFTLNRNLRKLLSAKEDLNFDRKREYAAAIKDKTKRPEGNREMIGISPEEVKEYQNSLQELLKREVEVDIHPIELYDSSAGETPDNPDCSIDIAIPEGKPNHDVIPNAVLARLLDVVFFETGHPIFKKG